MHFYLENVINYHSMWKWWKIFFTSESTMNLKIEASRSPNVEFWMLDLDDENLRNRNNFVKVQRISKKKKKNSATNSDAFWKASKFRLWNDPKFIVWLYDFFFLFSFSLMWNYNSLSIQCPNINRIYCVFNRRKIGEFYLVIHLEFDVSQIC